jgi:hypothetical protein
MSKLREAAGDHALHQRDRDEVVPAASATAMASTAAAPHDNGSRGRAARPTARADDAGSAPCELEEGSAHHRKKRWIIVPPSAAIKKCSPISTGARR